MSAYMRYIPVVFVVCALVEAAVAVGFSAILAPVAPFVSSKFLSRLATKLLNSYKSPL